MYKETAVYNIPKEDYHSLELVKNVSYKEFISKVLSNEDCKWGDITDYGAGEILECIRDRLYRINSISLEGETYFRKVKPDDFCSRGERREDAD